MDKEMRAKVNEILEKAQGRRKLSMEETEQVVGGGSYSTGVGSPNGNFGGLCQTTGCGENQKFWIASPEYIYMEANKVKYIPVDEETFYAYYMALRQIMPSEECSGRAHESTYAIYP